MSQSSEGGFVGVFISIGDLRGPVAQWLEQSTHNALVLGSSPSRPTMPTQFLA